jgi:class 3 adenylate cyclase
LINFHSDLRTVIDAVTNEVFQSDGTVIDYQGDGIFAAWGVPFDQPTQVTLAVKCAVAILTQLETMDLTVFRQSREKGGSVCGIGIAKGEVVAGDVGAGKMFKFGILGPSVNMTARLESLTKPGQLDAPILVTTEVRQALEKSDIPIRRVGRVRPAGMEDVKDIFEVVVKETTREAKWRQVHDGLWDELLSLLEKAHSPSELKDIDVLLRALPSEHPRTSWAASILKRLREKGALDTWTGVISQTKP